MSNKIALITGGTSGFGTVILKHLAQRGYDILILGRSVEKLEQRKKELSSKYPDINIDNIICNLSSFTSVVNACKLIKSKYTRIDLLIFNAGLWNFEFKESEDKIEETLQANLLSHLLILKSLTSLLPRGEESKVIFTASGLHQGEINFSDLEFRKNFSGFKAYRQSKLAIILLTRWLSKQKENQGISFYCVHPGMVNTNLGKNANWLSRLIFKLMGTSIENGAKTHLYLIDNKADSLSTGEYYYKNKVTKTTDYSYDMQVAEKLNDMISAYFTKFKLE